MRCNVMNTQKQGMHIKFNPSTAPMRLNVEVPTICGLAWIFHVLTLSSTANVPKNGPKYTEIRQSHLDLLVGHQPRRPNLPELPLGTASGMFA